MAKFDISKFAGNLKVCDSDTSGAREQIEYIDLSRIESDPRNFYTLSGVDELAANIELLGLQQPLRVRTSPENPEHVILVSGHRRHAALQKLVEEGRQDLASVPCIREASASSAALQELRLIFANSDTRKMTAAEISRQAERVEELLYLLKEEGMQFPGRMRDHVAEACRISAPKLARLKVIREKLIPEYMELFEKDQLPELTAYALARFPEDFQKRLSSVLSEPPGGRTTEEVLRKYHEGWRWEPDLKCPDGKPCKRGDAFLRRDCESSGFNGFCGGLTCCLECDKAKRDWSPCERMCARAKAQRKEKHDAEKEAEYRRKQKIGRKYQKETQAYAKRLLKAIDAAGLSEDIEIPWRTYYKNVSVSTVRKWAADEFNDPAEWYSAELEPERMDNAAAVSKLLQCSTDYLLGLTEELNPVRAPQEMEDQETVLSPDDAEDVLNNLESLLDDLSMDAPAVHRVRWERQGCTPPEGKPILTYALTNDGPVYRAVMWKDGQFYFPNGKKFASGLQYTKWLEIPLPDSGEEFQLAPLEPVVGQMVISGWMPGGTCPAGPCDAVADFRCGEDGPVIRDICWFDGTDFLFKHHGAKIDAECVRWMALPPVEGGHEDA